MNYFIIVVVVLALLIGGITFYNTIITKKWRNKIANEKDSWYLWVIYFNPSDKRIFLPKRTGLGYTVNFAQPVSIFLIGLLIIAITFLVMSKN